MFAYLYRYPIQDLFNVQVRTHSLNYVQYSQFEKNELGAKIMDLIDEKKPRIVWCGLLTSTKRKELIEKIRHSGVDEILDGYLPNTVLQLDCHYKPNFKWKNMPQIEKEIDKRLKECRDCGSPYEEIPFERGQYNGDNEPKIFC